ncbi:MAG: MotA/TolQ/ExbB proton channel family protein [Pirellulaceae bacterium]|jgi:biopolymer transport protein ExbB|nr:MotA/TolQ/ExbB proton channel family protein [Pirellulaceae bacterium]MDP7020035.1 MotA/TolQ/ExbB proton channel family protein [Pirellulaceae bacterium]
MSWGYTSASGRAAVWIMIIGAFWFAASPIAWRPALAQDELTEDLSDPGSSPAANAGGDESKERTLLDTVIDGGFIALLIFVLSIVAVAFIVEHSLSIRKGVLMPDHVMDEQDELIQQGRIDEAIESCLASDNSSMISQIVLAGLERYKSSEFGFAEYKAAVEEAGEDQTGRLYRKTEVLGLIGSIAPMLGLTGTVLGMIRAFNTIATEDMATPDKLAGGIGQALVTTLMGLVVAIPAMIAHSFFRNKIDSIISEAGKRVEQIMMPLGRRK